MTSKTTADFWNSYNSLPKEIKERARKVFRLFQNEPHHPGLYFKRIHSKKLIYSIRISRDYRAGILEKDDMIWFWIGSHSDYDKMIKMRRSKK